MLLRSDSRLATYLNDHLAGATAGLDLARRIAAAHQEHATTVDEIAREIASDRATLEDVMRRLDVDRNALKQLSAWTVEKARRALPHTWLLDRGGLGRMEELEMLVLGVSGKLALWRALAATHGDDPRLAGIDFDALCERARSQRDRLEQLRISAAVDVLR